jgi:hypothetical protein
MLSHRFPGRNRASGSNCFENPGMGYHRGLSRSLAMAGDRALFGQPFNQTRMQCGCGRISGDLGDSEMKLDIGLCEGFTIQTGFEVRFQRRLESGDIFVRGDARGVLGQRAFEQERACWKFRIPPRAANKWRASAESSLTNAAGEGVATRARSPVFHGYQSHASQRK